MDQRRQELLRFHLHLDKIDKEVTMVLQSLQWNREQLLEGMDIVTCSNDSNHRMPGSALEHHEKDCLLKSNGYSKDEKLLPEVIDQNASSVVKLTYQDIQKITNISSNADPQHYKEHASGPSGPEPLSLARLQQRYPPTARAAIHDAVVAAAPDHTHFTPLTLPSESARAPAGACVDDDGRAAELAAQAALRDTRRRRARYRTLCSGNYSDSLRTLIHSQMELYTDAQQDEANETKEDLKMSDNATYTRGKSMNTDETIKKGIKSPDHPYKKDEYVTDTKRAHDKDYFNSSEDTKSGKERWRGKHGNVKERDHSHNRNEKRPNYSTGDSKHYDQNSKKIHKYSDRYDKDKYVERNNKTYNVDSRHHTKYRRYNDEVRQKLESSTSRYCDREHNKSSEKTSPERIQNHKRNKDDNNFKVGVSYKSSNSSSSKESSRSYHEKRAERSQEEVKVHKKHRHKEHRIEKEKKIPF